LDKAKSKAEIKKIKARIEKEKFYKYQVKDDQFDGNEFDKLSENDQKKVLLDMLDMNHLYVNLDSRRDSTFEVSKEDIELTRKFYKQKSHE
jgi:adenine-specific DNA-methyltransferase